MKNYPVIRTQKGIFDTFDDFFKPMFYDDSHDMRTDIRETDDGYLIEIEMPGFKKDQIGINLEDGYLTVEGTKAEKTDGKYLHKEMKESFHRSYYVGDDLPEDAVHAKYEDGILSLTVPKAAPKKPASRNIPIE